MSILLLLVLLLHLPPYPLQIPNSILILTSATNLNLRVSPHEVDHTLANTSGDGLDEPGVDLLKEVSRVLVLAVLA